MFYVITSGDKLPLTSRLFHRKITSHKVDFGGAPCYTQVALPNPARRREIRQVEHLLLTKHRPVIVAENLLKLKHLQTAVDSLPFQAYSTVLSGLHFAEILSQKAPLKSLAYYDPTGIGRDYLHLFYPLFPVVQVVTNRLNFYEVECVRALDSCGLSLLVSDSVTPAFHCQFALCLTPPPRPLSFSNKTLVLSFVRENLYTPLLYTCGEDFASDSVASLLPPKVDPLTFLSATFNQLGDRDLTQCRATTLSHRGQQVSYSEAVANWVLTDKS